MRVRLHVMPLLCFLLVLLGGCRLSEPEPSPEAAPVATRPLNSTRPVVLPDDEGPHDVLTEWWYFTGHLYGEHGARYGFEFVVFQSVRGQDPVGYLAHFAVTDAQQGDFRYSSRLVQKLAIPDRLDLDVDGWRLRGEDGRYELKADMGPYALELRLASTKPPVLHHGGLISFGAAGDSYYYSRTRLASQGVLHSANRGIEVYGQAWFDHQWGNFIVPPLGGWDWFGLQLDDGTELMLSLLRDASGAVTRSFGSYVDRSGRLIELAEADFSVVPLDFWSSPHTGAVYPARWRIRLAAKELPAMDLVVSPVLSDQELVFPQLAYWEGAVEVEGSIGGQLLVGRGYVELTGYQP